MDNREYPSRGGRETVAAQRNNTLPDIRAKLSALHRRSGCGGSSIGRHWRMTGRDIDHAIDVFT